MGGKDDILTRSQIDDALSALPDWRYRLGGLVTVFKAPTAAGALELIAAVGRIAEEKNHHPDVDWRYNRVFVRFTSHDAGTEVTSRDVRAATAVSDAAAKTGATAEPALYRTVEFAIDTANPSEISGVWKAALGYRAGRYGDLVDPYGRGPGLWFQKTDTPNDNRIHVDVHQGKAESAHTLEKTAATGALMNHDHAPNWVVVTDAQGNRLCLCTEQGHEPDL
ncbi:4a-hydroxytetrahydrobiopterin dehydratase [Pseudarthrobacter sp. N5]|uniref:4a-hydroxytetrahydrobiopterin dehydratase n=1 Tax=Pseudarthrobacter sp. N5 TaxID=3418416 RepID=UPI003CE67B8E